METGGGEPRKRPSTPAKVPDLAQMRFEKRHEKADDSLLSSTLWPHVNVTSCRLSSLRRQLSSLLVVSSCRLFLSSTFWATFGQILTNLANLKFPAILPSLEISFSVVSNPISAGKCSFCRICQVVQYLCIFALLQIQFLKFNLVTFW